ncbi:hypothetical protein LEP1GSC021_4174 [Leptospira noguchii str. 1993005606]|uniref:Uncharacterized protein n=2 Tax=Leptospira noguchii TaxID=28182 RepID=M6YFD7_9LEPT|nr:hypothetical protein LEP1GSC035_2939 [Leptospira noguchii str. 2007001578]EMO88359.1 hypothetical protein LEP1GSC024_4627 [Leptospira noguchii str. 2001034031]EPE82021.1 hypothetical protein LEP1GSC021_4174 [Leptospira noguchii str. 1993005606]
MRITLTHKNNIYAELISKLKMCCFFQKANKFGSNAIFENVHIFGKIVICVSSHT